MTFANRMACCRLAEQRRLHEGARQVAAMARGFASVFSLRALTLLTWQELEVLTCGSPTISTCAATADLPDEQRSDFVRFDSGRSRSRSGS